MQKNVIAILACFVGCVGNLVQASSPIAQTITLPSTSGQAVTLEVAAEHRLQVVCFIGCECPLAKLYAGRLNELAEAYREQQVRFVAVNSNRQDSMEEISRFAADHRLTFPIVKDHDARAMLAFGATRTPQVFLLDSLGNVIYQGRIDDQYRPGVAQNSATRNDLKQAIDEALAGVPVSIARTEPAGCLIAKPRSIETTSDVTYCGQIAAILTKHCIECHRPGEIGPFSLTDYDEVVGWADMILETIDQQRMPPWHAATGHVPLLNERQMPQAERELVRTWVQAGAPYGDPKQLPALPTFTSGWQLPEPPDQVLTVSETPFVVPADGVVEYQYFVVDPQFEQEVWVDAAEILPGNRSVVHHAIAFIRPPDGVPIDGLALLTAYVPGQRVAPPTKGLAKRIPAGSKIVFQMHYTPTGEQQSDLSKLGLSFVDREEVERESISMLGINHELEIPPQEANVQVAGSTSHFPPGSQLLSLAPHMHLRGKAVTVTLRQPAGTQTVLEVPHYDFNWQHTYLLKDPLPLDDVSAIDFVATFDNSKANPFNPDPAQFVTWGDQTWEEMAIVFYEIAKPVKPRKAELREAKRTEKMRSSPEPAATDYQALADQLATDLDKNGDGTIEYGESDLAVRWRLFRWIDANDDRLIDREELLQYVKTYR